MVVADVDTGHDQRRRFVEESMNADLHRVGGIPGAGPGCLAVEFNLGCADRSDSGNRLADPTPLLVGHDDADRAESPQGVGERNERGAIDAVVVGQQDPGHASGQRSSLKYGIPRAAGAPRNFARFPLVRAIIAMIASKNGSMSSKVAGTLISSVWNVKLSRPAIPNR